VDLVRDYLDKQLGDRHGKPIGRIDGIAIEIEDGEQPRVIAVEVGSVAQARRLGRRFHSYAIALAQRWGLMRENPHRFAFGALECHDKHYRIDKLASEVPTLEWERWIRENVIDRIPGS
jgi:hypothetical protein